MASENGWPIWYELMTPDVAKVAPFYRAIFGWDLPPQGMTTPNGTEYRMMLRGDGGNIGGVLTLSPNMQQMGMEPGWFTYFYVDDADKAAAKVTELGGQVHMGPMEMAAGKIAMVSDAFGAVFYLMKATPPADRPDAQSDVFTPGKAGCCAWNELGTSDGPGAVAFYNALFGWKSDDFMPMGPAGEYRFIELAGTQIGAISPALAEGSKPGWLPYFRAANINGAKTAALANGGKLIMDAHEVPGDDMIIIVSDPSGAQLGIAAAK